MYISRLPLNARRPEAIRLLSSPYRMHAAVENAFPPDACRVTDEGRILWRIDSSPAPTNETWLYVVSPDRPDFSSNPGGLQQALARQRTTRPCLVGSMRGRRGASG